MPRPIDFKTLVNVELGLENSTQNGNMKKKVFFAPLFLYNLALITHDATKSMNPSVIFNSVFVVTIRRSHLVFCLHIPSQSLYEVLPWKSKFCRGRYGPPYIKHTKIKRLLLFLSNTNNFTRLYTAQLKRNSKSFIFGRLP